MNGYAYVQKGSSPIAGWIMGWKNSHPRTEKDLTGLTLNIAEAARFDVDNYLEVLNNMVENGWSLMIAGNKYDAVQPVSSAPFMK
jgi:hypothetical protein